MASERREIERIAAARPKAVFATGVCVASSVEDGARRPSVPVHRQRQGGGQESRTLRDRGDDTRDGDERPGPGFDAP